MKYKEKSSEETRFGLNTVRMHAKTSQLLKDTTV